MLHLGLFVNVHISDKGEFAVIAVEGNQTLPALSTWKKLSSHRRGIPRHRRIFPRTRRQRGCVKLLHNRLHNHPERTRTAPIVGLSGTANSLKTLAGRWIRSI